MKERLDLAEFVSGFVAEAEVHLQVARARLVDIQDAQSRAQSNPRAVRDLFRALHTIKGLAGMVAVEPIEELAHAMEAVLRVAESAGGRLMPAAMEPMQAGLRLIDEGVRALAEGRSVKPIAPELIEQLRKLENVTPAQVSAAVRHFDVAPELWQKLSVVEREELERGGADGRAAFVVHFAPSPRLVAEGRSITQLREAASRVGQVIKVVPIAVPQSDHAPGGLEFKLLMLSELDAPALSAELQCEPEAIQRLARTMPEITDAPALLDEQHDPWRGRAVRIDVERLDDAFERLAALVVTRFRVERITAKLAEQGADVRELRQVLVENARQMRDMRAAILRLRLVPVSEMLEPLPLVVRGLSSSTAKPLELTLDGTSAELDKSVADRVFPALVHLIRNAVDHGIEPPEERRMLGKKEHGQLRVECTERAGARLELRISDDGRGIDVQKLARVSGRVPRSRAELLDIIATPGFSTKPEASRTSGRGMGVDIVRRVLVDELGGELIVESEPGVGTTFVLRVPLTVTIIDSFAFEVASQRFVAPVSMVEEIIEIDPGAVRYGPRSDAGREEAIGFFERRGRALPLLDLGRLFQLTAMQAAPKALVVRRDETTVAFGVDRMLGRQEVVVRTLNDPLVRVPGISGSADLGDGKPTLVLDLFSLSRRAAASLEVEA